MDNQDPKNQSDPLINSVIDELVWEIENLDKELEKEIYNKSVDQTNK